MKRIAIFGIGGVGGYLGTKLALRYSGEPDIEIIFIQRGEHLKKIQADGLIYITRDNRHTAHPSLATDKPERAGFLDIVLFSVKSYSLAPAADSLLPCITDGTLIISAMNGVDTHERLQEAFPDSPVLPGCIYMSAAIQEPGIVRQTGGVGPFYFGRTGKNSPNDAVIEGLLTESGIKARLDDRILSRLWEKFAFVSPLAALTTLHGEPIGAVVGNRDHSNRLEMMVEEIRGLAEASGVELPPDIKDSVLDRARLIPFETRTSMQVDAQAGRRTEIDMFIRSVIDRAAAAGVAVPQYEESYTRLLEKGLNTFRH